MQPASNNNILRVMLRSTVISALVGGGLIGCGTPTLKGVPAITQTERIQRDQVLGASFARQFESHLNFKENKDVLIYLRGLAQSLADATPELKSFAVGVQVVQDSGGIWRDYSFPASRIYLSLGLLKGVRYENELAAAIALQFGHILRRHGLSRIQEQGHVKEAFIEGASGAAPVNSPTHYLAVDGLPNTLLIEGAPTPIDYFSPTGIFSFPDDFYTSAAEVAVQILYRAGYDPRGLIELWNRYLAESDHSPYDENLLKKLLEKTRSTIALQSPLRNPIVRSPAFLTIQKRMHKL